MTGLSAGDYQPYSPEFDNAACLVLQAFTVWSLPQKHKPSSKL